MYELEKMREFATREKAIISDGRLSQDGRYEAIKKLNDEKLQYKPVAVAGVCIENYRRQAPGITAGAFRKYRSYSGDDHCYFTA
jgi:hypothetical protein